MKKMKTKGRMILSVILSLFMALSSSVYTFAIEDNESGPITVGPFSLQTTVDGNLVSVTLSVNNNPGNLTAGSFSFSADAADFSLTKPQMSAGSVLTNANMEPSCKYRKALRKH